MSTIYSNPDGSWTVTVATEVFGQAVERSYTGPLFDCIQFRQEATR